MDMDYPCPARSPGEELHWEQYQIKGMRRR